MAGEEEDRSLNRLVDGRATSRPAQEGRSVAGRAVFRSTLSLDGRTGIVAAIYFSNSQTDLSTDDIAVLKSVAEAYEPVLRREKVSFTFTGHAAWRGAKTVEAQNKIALRRAEVTAEALKSLVGGSTNYAVLLRSYVSRRARDAGSDRVDITAPPLKLANGTVGAQAAAISSVQNPCLAKDVRQIPMIMDRLNYRQGATLMRKWLNTPAAAGRQIDDSTIKMDFVLRFARARQSYLGIVINKAWYEPARTAELLRREKLDRPGTKFDFTKRKPVDLKPGPGQKSVEVGFVTCGGQLDPTDELKAALGRFALMIVVGGRVDNDTGGSGLRVTITKIGVFVADVFDFEDSAKDEVSGWMVGYGASQPLGVWNACRNTARMALGVFADQAVGDHTYSNQDFRNFRQRTGRGRDLWVLSDMRVIEFDPRSENLSSFVIPR